MIRGYSVAIGSILLGLLAVIVVQFMSLPDGGIASAVTLSLFLTINLILAHLLGVKKELRQFWSVRSSIYFVYGSISGLFIIAIPMCLAFLLHKGTSNAISFPATFSFSGMGLTIIIVAWEELWFRGVFLNYCKKYLSPINLSLTIGLLFMLSHALNPTINLVREGPTLFLAGSLLTLLYFRFQTIWLPLGLHWGNNFFGSMITFSHSSDIIWGSDGFVTALLLGGLYIFFVMKHRSVLPWMVDDGQFEDAPSEAL